MSSWSSLPRAGRHRPQSKRPFGGTRPAGIRIPHSSAAICLGRWWQTPTKAVSGKLFIQLTDKRGEHVGLFSVGALAALVNYVLDPWPFMPIRGRCSPLGNSWFCAQEGSPSVSAWTYPLIVEALVAANLSVPFTILWVGPEPHTDS